MFYHLKSSFILCKDTTNNIKIALIELNLKDFLLYEFNLDNKKNF